MQKLNLINGRDVGQTPALPGESWLCRATNSTVCCLCLLLLSPAIVAVWIAIRRSTQPLAKSDQETDVASHSPAALGPMRIVLKPERFRRGEPLRNNSLTEPVLAAQAAV